MVRQDYRAHRGVGHRHAQASTGAQRQSGVCDAHVQRGFGQCIHVHGSVMRADDRIKYVKIDFGRPGRARLADVDEREERDAVRRGVCRKGTSARVCLDGFYA